MRLLSKISHKILIVYSTQGTEVGKLGGIFRY